jgi:Amt family ammonium transporter
VSPFGAICIGAIAGVVVVFGVDLIEHFRVDDPIGAWPVHGLCGIWGTLSLGLFATGQYGVPGATGADTSATVNGLFYGGGWEQLKMQAYGSAVVILFAGVVGLIVMYAVKATGTLRISEEHELEGIDIVEHGAPAYHPEFAYMGYSAIPAGRGSGGVRLPKDVPSTLSVGD